MNTTLILAVIATAVITATVSVSITTYNAEAQVPESVYECMIEVFEQYRNATSDYSHIIGEYSGMTTSTSDFVQAANTEAVIVMSDIIDKGHTLNFKLEYCKAVFR